MQLFRSKAGPQTQTHSSRNCNLHEEYECYVVEHPCEHSGAAADAWESAAVQKLREAIMHDADHLERLRRSMDDGGLRIGFTNMSLKEVWLNPNFKEMMKKIISQKVLLQDEDDIV